MSLPRGLFYHQNVIPQALIAELSEWFNSEDFSKRCSPITKHPNSRRVAHFGYRYDYLKGNIDEPTDPLPPILIKLRELIGDYIEGDADLFNQCIINRYLPGQGISAHIDRTSYGEVIACFSLGSGAIMEFTRTGFPKYPIYVEPGSLYLMSDDARYKWKHQMTNRMSDKGHGPPMSALQESKILGTRNIRWSVTYRIVDTE